MTKSIARAAAALVLCACLPCAAHAADQSAAAKGIRSYPLPGNGALVMDVPLAWKQQILQAGGPAPTIVLTPAKGDEFRVMITPLWDPNGAPPLGPDEMQKIIDMDVSRMLPTAVEKEVVVQQIVGRDGTGYHFLVTDKAPKPGDYPYAARAGIVVGDLLLSTTILCRSKDTPAIAATIAALRSARQMGK
jgi:hypothetical protein